MQYRMQEAPEGHPAKMNAVVREAFFAKVRALNHCPILCVSKFSLTLLVKNQFQCHVASQQWDKKSQLTCHPGRQQLGTANSGHCDAYYIYCVDLLEGQIEVQSVTRFHPEK